MFVENIRDGFEIYPIKVQIHPEYGDKYRILDGVHRWHAYKEIGAIEIPVHVITLDGVDPLLYAAKKAIGPLNLGASPQGLFRENSTLTSRRLEACLMVIQEFKSNDTVNKLWWLHDSFWHAALIKELGPERANRLNLEVSEKIFRMLTITLLRERIIERPHSIQELMFVFKTVWKNAFFDELYVNDPITYEGNTAIWTGNRCHAYDSLGKANMLESYECGCQALRNGVMKALRLKPFHEIRESLINGDGRCVIKVTFSPSQ